MLFLYVCAVSAVYLLVMSSCHIWPDSCSQSISTGLVVAAKSYHQAHLVEPSMVSCVKVLSKLGEEPLRDIGDATLNNDLLTMNRKLRGMSDESILNIQENTLKKYETIMKLYSQLGEIVSSCRELSLWFGCSW